jgi:hypothetical protein
MELLQAKYGIHDKISFEFDSRIKAHNDFYDRNTCYDKLSAEQKKLAKLNDVFIIGKNGASITSKDIVKFVTDLKKYAANKLWDNGKSYCFEGIYKTKKGFAISWGS